MSIAQNLEKVRATLPSHVELVAVSKTRPPGDVMEAWRAGQRIFGENRPQEMAAKRAVLASLLAPDSPDATPPAGIRWHQIGHLQTNKVRLIAPFVDLIHSADSARLLREIDRQAVLNGRAIDVLLEIKIAREASKEGWEWGELTDWLETGEYRNLGNINFRGTMGVATFTDDEATVRAEFQNLARMHTELRKRFFNAPAAAPFDILSMGMSDDYSLAIECGATMVRIGSLVFGAREYK